MLKKNNRLKKRYQFSYVYRAGKSFSGEFLTIYFCPSKTKDIKVGFTVTKKLGHAHIRNLIRRRLREIVYGEIPNLKQNFNLIVVAKESCLQASFESLKTELDCLFQKADLKK